MATTEESKVETSAGVGGVTPGEAQADECADIKDPRKRALCRLCGPPVFGDAAFCKDHEPPGP